MVDTSTQMIAHLRKMFPLYRYVVEVTLEAGPESPESLLLARLHTVYCERESK